MFFSFMSQKMFLFGHIRLGVQSIYRSVEELVVECLGKMDLILLLDIIIRIEKEIEVAIYYRDWGGLRIVMYLEQMRRIELDDIIQTRRRKKRLVTEMMMEKENNNENNEIEKILFPAKKELTKTDLNFLRNKWRWKNRKQDHQNINGVFVQSMYNSSQHFAKWKQEEKERELHNDYREKAGIDIIVSIYDDKAWIGAPICLCRFDSGWYNTNYTSSHFALCLESAHKYAQQQYGVTYMEPARLVEAFREPRYNRSSSASV